MGVFAHLPLGLGLIHFVLQLLGARDASKGAAAVEALAKEGLSAELVVCDIASPDGAAAATDAIARTNGAVLDIVCWCACVRLDCVR